MTLAHVAPLLPVATQPRIRSRVGTRPGNTESVGRQRVERLGIAVGSLALAAHDAAAAAVVQLASGRAAAGANDEHGELLAGEHARDVHTDDVRGNAHPPTRRCQRDRDPFALCNSTFDATA